MTHMTEEKKDGVSGYIESVGLWDKFTGFLFGDDIFISYSHGDARDYALALARSLSDQKFVCYLDQYGTEANDELPPSLIRRLKRSIVLVLIGTSDSVQSGFVKEEVRIFAQTGRPTIPLNIGSAFDDAKWIKIVKGNPVSDDKPALKLNGKTDEFILEVTPEQVVDVTEKERLSVTPSSLTVNRVISSFKYTKRADRQKRMFLAAFILLLTSFVAVAVSAKASLDATLKAADAEQQKKFAKAEAIQAAKEAQAAEVQKLQAQRDRDIAKNDADKATSDKKLADKAKKQADIDKNRADELAARAEDREAKARQAEKQARDNAIEQGEIAASSHLASRALTTLEHDSAASLQLSQQAYTRHPTVLARSSLLKSVQRHPHLHKLIRQHHSHVRNIALTPDGKVLASAERWRIVFYDVPLNRKLASFDAESLSLVASSDSARFAAWTSSKTITVWEVTGGGEQRTVEQLGQPFEVKLMKTTRSGLDELPFALSVDGRTLIYGSWEEDKKSRKAVYGLAFLNIDERGEPDFSPTLKGRPNALALSSDGQTLAVAYDNLIELWDINKRKARCEPNFTPIRKETSGSAGEPLQQFRSLSFSPDGKTLAAAGRSRTVILWDVESRRMLGEPLSDAGYMVAFISEGKSLATMSQDTLAIWNVEGNARAAPKKRWTEVYVPGLLSLVSSADDGKMLVTGNLDGTIAFWKPDAAGQLVRTEERRPANHLDFNAAGDLLLSKSEWIDGVDIWDFSAAHGTLSPSKLKLRDIKDSAFRPVANPSNQVVNDSKKPDFYSQTVHVQNMSNNADPPPTLQIKHSILTPRGPAVSPDGTLLAALEARGVVLWDITDSSNPSEKFLLQLQQSDTQQAFPTCVSFSRNGKLVVAGYNSGEVVLWDLVNRNEPKHFRAAETGVPGKVNIVESVAVSDDGKTIAASSRSSKRIYLWDASTREPTLLGSLDKKWPRRPPELSGDADPLNGDADFIFMHRNPGSDAAALAFHPNGQLLVSANAHGITVWDIDARSWAQRAQHIISVDK